MKNLFMRFFFLLLFISILSSCSAKPVSESQIKKDIVGYEKFSNLSVSDVKFEILKRKTDMKDKIDEVYVLVSGKNDDYSVVRNYKLTYELYNDGWMLEKVGGYNNKKNPDETVPLHGISYQEVKEYIKTINYEKLSSFDFDRITGMKVYTSIEDGDTGYLPMAGNGICNFSYDLVFTTHLFDEKTIVPVEFYFGGSDDSKDNFGWRISRPSFRDLKRKLEFNDGILGIWKDDGNKRILRPYLNGCMEISDYSSDHCFIDSLYINDKNYVVSGEAFLDYDISPNDGKLHSPKMILKDNNIYSNYCDITLEPNFRNSTPDIVIELDYYIKRCWYKS